MMETLRAGDALIVVDVQNDFVTGSLAVPDAKDILPAVEDIVGKFRGAGLPVYASMCWHPPDHCSFRERGGPWPSHCVQFTNGAGLATDIKFTRIIFKGTHRDCNAYSAFNGGDGTGITLASQLASPHTKRLFICGIATDYCVKATVLDALKLGYPVVLVVDAIAAVAPDTGAAAAQAMYDAGAIARITKYIQPH